MSRAAAGATHSESLVRLFAVLLAAGAAVDRTKTSGSTALVVAARFGHLPVVQCLLGAGAKAPHKQFKHLNSLNMVYVFKPFKHSTVLHGKLMSSKGERFKTPCCQGERGAGADAKIPFKHV